MTVTEETLDLQYALDGNSVAGVLFQLFGVEMTVNPARCAYCGNVSVVGEMLVFGREMGTILRCPTCMEVVVRIAERPDGILLDMRGLSYIRLPA